MTTETIVSLAGLLGIGATIAGQWAVQRTKINDLFEAVKELRSVVDSHLQRTDIHVDPVRDEQRWSALARSLERIEERLDKIFHGEKERGKID